MMRENIPKKGIEDRSKEFREHAKGVEELNIYTDVVQKKFLNPVLF